MELPAQPRLVLLRGLIRSRFHWEQFPTYLQQALPDFELVIPELAGNGERYQEQTPFSVHGMMEDIRQQVRLQQQQPPEQQPQEQQQTHNQPVIIIAVSMGAMIASEWARCYPQEIKQLHLINTSFSNLSLPWQRMQAPAFFSLLSHFFNREKLEQAIIRWTINLYNDPQLTTRWQNFSATHPLSYRNAIAQLLSASRYKGPTTAPVADSYFYNSPQDKLVSGRCTERIAGKWQKPLFSHKTAGHDLPLDDPHWLITNIKSNIEAASQND